MSIIPGANRRKANGFGKARTILSLAISRPAGSNAAKSKLSSVPEDALRNLIAIEPGFWPAHLVLGEAYHQKGKLDEAIDAMTKARQLDDAAGILASLGNAYAVAGKRTEALEAVRELESRSELTYVPAFTRAMVYAGLGNSEKAFAWLEKAYQDREEELLMLAIDPRWDPLRPDPRFKDILRRMNLVSD